MVSVRPSAHRGGHCGVGDPPQRTVARARFPAARVCIVPNGKSARVASSTAAPATKVAAVRLGAGPANSARSLAVERGDEQERSLDTRAPAETRSRDQRSEGGAGSIGQRQLRLWFACRTACARKRGAEQREEDAGENSETGSISGGPIAGSRRVNHDAPVRRLDDAANAIRMSTAPAQGDRALKPVRVTARPQPGAGRQSAQRNTGEDDAEHQAPTRPSGP